VIAGILLADGDLVHGGEPLALMRSDADETLIEWQVAEMQQAGVEVIEVVLGSQADRLIPLVSGNDVEPIVNDRWQEGEASSLRVGATATPRNTTTAVLVRLQQPRESAGIKTVLLQHIAAESTVSRPVAGDTPGWPVVINADVLARVRNLPDGVDIEDVLRDYDTLVVRIEGEMPDLR
jgi:CTP:molybdopterin cytidylyltransferase MocA